MKNETRENFGSTARFNKAALEMLKQKGFRYVQIKGFTTEKKLDYMEPRYLLLIPIKELPVDSGEMEIYEPVDSKLLVDWAAHPRDGMTVLIAKARKV
jgi:hypothetical protein